MRKSLLLPALCMICLGYQQAVHAQGKADTSNIQTTFPEKALDRLARSGAGMEQAIHHSSQKTIRKIRRIERKISRLAGLSDSSTASYYQKLETAADSASRNLFNFSSYIPSIDSLQTSLRFLGVRSDITDNLSAVQQRYTGAAGIGQSLGQRYEVLCKMINIPAAGKYLRSIDKEIYYYRRQLAEYKSMLADPDKLARRLVDYARQMPAFRDFFLKNSSLSSLFRLPGGTPDPAALAGLQTRAQVQGMVNAAIPANADPQQYLQGQLAAAQAELDKLKNRINQLGGGSSELSMPSFRPNNQRTKSFWKRLEAGMDIQSQRPNQLLPVTSDIALSLGYRLNDNSTIGIGAGYKLGWGQNFSHIRFTSEGFSLRSFLDIKVKGGFWASGGFEYNYQQSFSGIAELQDLSRWQKSALLGITKKYRIGKKQGKLQLLWDFISYDQVPKTQPLKFRVGYQL
ncbi:hypothetical protein [Sediminibacterium soli]|uniref:hypothetical protein n=1 Tax=Sediminibacterium soli TaxID=2698829 RepID=UPI00137B3BD3|nr:hypothetical protein [Sediminibacterium soli]NCI45658.1 hypothetical protein [Sediminibacterium soli]